MVSKSLTRQPWFNMLKIYAENMADHRQNVFRVPMNAIEIRKSKLGELEFDFSRFDQIAEIFWNTGKDGLPGNRISGKIWK